MTVPSADPPETPLRDRLLTGTDDRAFCERVSRALEDGYRLYRNPAIAVDGQARVVAQALVHDADGKTLT